MYTLGVPHTVFVDDWLPLQEDFWNGGFQTFFAHMGDDSALWMPLLEKAFAKYYGNYERIAGGNPMKAVRALNGSPFDSYWHIRGAD